MQNIKEEISEESRILLGELKVLIEQNVVLPSRVKRCRHCNEIVKGLVYCDEWCREQDINSRTNYYCKCGNLCSPYYRNDRNGTRTSSGVYHKECEECRAVNKLVIKRNKIKTNE